MDRALEEVIVSRLDARAVGTTICPSQAARAVADDDFAALMEPARRAARKLVARGEVVVTQQGRVVDLSTAKGPIRLRKA